MAPDLFMGSICGNCCRNIGSVMMPLMTPSVNMELESVTHLSIRCQRLATHTVIAEEQEAAGGRRTDADLQVLPADLPTEQAFVCERHYVCVRSGQTG